MTDPHPSSQRRWVLHVVDTIDARAAGRDGCVYTSPAHSAEHARQLVRVLLGCPPEPAAGPGPWTTAIAGGRRTVTLQPLPDTDRGDA